jgi:hypothetical protein
MQSIILAGTQKVLFGKSVFVPDELNDLQREQKTALKGSSYDKNTQPDLGPPPCRIFAAATSAIGFHLHFSSTAHGPHPRHRLRK